MSVLAKLAKGCAPDNLGASVLQISRSTARSEGQKKRQDALSWRAASVASPINTKSSSSRFMGAGP
jgi:hypothetical protein